MRNQHVGFTWAVAKVVTSNDPSLNLRKQVSQRNQKKLSGMTKTSPWRIGTFAEISPSLIKSSNRTLNCCCFPSTLRMILCLVTRRKIRHTPDLNQNIHQRHFLPIRKCLRFGSLAYNPYLFAYRALQTLSPQPSRQVAEYT